MLKPHSLLSIRSTRSLLEKQTCVSPTSEYARTVLSPRQKLEAQHDLDHLKRRSLDFKSAERKLWWEEQRYIKSLAVKTAKDQERQEIEYRAEQRRKSIAYEKETAQAWKSTEHQRHVRAAEAMRLHKTVLTEEDKVKSTDEYQRTVISRQQTKSQLMEKVREDAREKRHAELRESKEQLRDKVKAQGLYRRMEHSAEQVERDYAQAKHFEERLTEQQRLLARVKSELQTAERATRARKNRK